MDWSRALEVDLTTVPPRVDILKIVLHHLVDSMKQLTPRRKDIHCTIDNHIDIALICQMVEHGAITREDMAALVDFCFKHIKRLQCPNDDRRTGEWHDRVHAAMAADEFSAATFFSVFLKDTMDMVSRIHEQINAFHAKFNKHT